MVLSANAQAGVQVHFDQDEHVIQPGQDFQVQVLLDGDDTQPGTQALAGTLFSMGIKVAFGSDKANVADITAIVLPDEINGDGVGDPAFKEVGSGFACTTGAVGLEDCLTVLDFPEHHRRRLRSTNMLESLMKRLKKRSRVAGVFPGRSSCDRLLGAQLIEIHEAWSVQEGPYFNMLNVDLQAVPVRIRAVA